MVFSPKPPGQDEIEQAMERGHERDTGGWCLGSKCTCWQSETLLGYAKAGATRADLVAAWLEGTDDLPDTAPVTICIAGRHRYYDDLKILRLLSSSSSPPHVTGSHALLDVAAERQRQVSVEGFSAEHDDRHGRGRLSGAASAYALSAAASLMTGKVAPIVEPPPFFRWDRSWWKPTTARRDLVKAAALIIAEIERIDRQAVKS